MELLGADLTLHERWLGPEDAARLFAELRETTAWRQESIRVFGRVHAVPRLQAWYGDEGVTYAYSGLHLEPLPWTAPLAELRARLHETLPEASFDSALVNLYRDGRDSNGWHADDEPELGPRPTIASLSLGAVRRFRMKPRRGDAPPLSLDLAAGSLLVMAGTTQRDWLHAVPKTARPVGERINVTFRRTGAARTSQVGVG